MKLTAVIIDSYFKSCVNLNCSLNVFTFVLSNGDVNVFEIFFQVALDRSEIVP